MFRKLAAVVILISPAPIIAQTLARGNVTLQQPVAMAGNRQLRPNQLHPTSVSQTWDNITANLNQPASGASFGFSYIDGVGVPGQKHFAGIQITPSQYESFDTAEMVVYEDTNAGGAGIVMTATDSLRLNVYEDVGNRLGALLESSDAVAAASLPRCATGYTHIYA